MLMNGDYLVHYGIPGMKWGVRKEKPLSRNPRKRAIYFGKLEQKLGDQIVKRSAIDYKINRKETFGKKASKNLYKKQAKITSKMQKIGAEMGRTYNSLTPEQVALGREIAYKKRLYASAFTGKGAHVVDLSGYNWGNSSKKKK